MSNRNLIFMWYLNANGGQIKRNNGLRVLKPYTTKFLIHFSPFSPFRNVQESRRISDQSSAPNSTACHSREFTTSKYRKRSLWHVPSAHHWKSFCGRNRVPGFRSKCDLSSTSYSTREVHSLFANLHRDLIIIRSRDLPFNLHSTRNFTPTIWELKLELFINYTHHSLHKTWTSPKKNFC